jgi:hypothetical protein
MSSARGQANHALYLARILIEAWQRDSAAESVAATTLAQAYVPAIRAHLTAAYGWFLLEITRPGTLPEQPPRSIDELPQTATGKALPGEIRELRRLEQDDWIGELLSVSVVSAPTVSAGNLAVSVAGPTPAQAGDWADRLQTLFDRMGDSLDEY